VASSFWKDVARSSWRAIQHRSRHDDLIDYLYVARQADARFSLKGRTLSALQRRMEEWHRETAQNQAIGGGS